MTFPGLLAWEDLLNLTLCPWGRKGADKPQGGRGAGSESRAGGGRLQWGAREEDEGLPSAPASQLGRRLPASSGAKVFMKIFQALGWHVKGKEIEEETYFGFFKTVRDSLSTAGAEDDSIFIWSNYPRDFFSPSPAKTHCSNAHFASLTFHSSQFPHFPFTF